MDGTVIFLRLIRRISYPSFVQPAPGCVGNLLVSLTTRLCTVVPWLRSIKPLSQRLEVGNFKNKPEALCTRQDKTEHKDSINLGL